MDESPEAERARRWQVPLTVLVAAFLFDLGQGVLRPTMPLYPHSGLEVLCHSRESLPENRRRDQELSSPATENYTSSAGHQLSR